MSEDGQSVRKEKPIKCEFFDRIILLTRHRDTMKVTIHGRSHLPTVKLPRSPSGNSQFSARRERVRGQPAVALGP